jgi:hypothetical protein
MIHGFAALNETPVKKKEGDQKIFKVWKSLKIFENLWKSLKIFENLWKSLKILKYLEKIMLNSRLRKFSNFEDLQKLSNFN